MKNTLIFLAGAAIGAASAIIWLRKDIKKRIAEIENSKQEEELPFEVSNSSDNEAKNEQNTDENADKVAISDPVDIKKQQKIEYNSIINEVKNADAKALDTQKMPPFDVFQERKEPVPIMPRDDFMPNLTEEEVEPSVIPRNEIFFEVDRDDFDHDDEYEKKRLVYFSGDHVMCTEAGTIIDNPYLFVGNQWEQYVGHYAEKTAFVRNTRLREDYEIYVENGSYVDEYGYDSL